MSQEAQVPGQVTTKEFADKIRAKYPDSKLYKEKSDSELATAWIKAKPEREVYKKKIKDWPLESTEKSIGYPSGTQWPITPKDGESFQDTVKRGIVASKTDKLGQEITKDPQKRAEYLTRAIKEAPWGKAAATYGLIVALPFVLAESGIAIRSPFVKKVVRDAASGRMKSVPSTVSKIVEHLKQPGSIVKTPYGRAIEYYLLSKAGMTKSAIDKLIGIVKD